MIKVTLIAVVFFSAFSCFAQQAEPVEKKQEYIRVTEDESQARLQTSITTLEKDGKRVDLVGAIHIADAAYYETLNERFPAYDRVLFEMVGGEKIGQSQEEKDKESEQPAEKGNLSGLRDIYTMVATFLQLKGQSETIDYKAKNFVHADLTMKEFQDKQKERNESLLGLALKAGVNPETQKNVKQPDATKLMQAMLSGNGNMMKLELIHTLGDGDDQIGMFAGETVILTDLNAKCIEVLDQEIAKGHENLAVFYGAAHFSSMEKSLTDKGWKRTKEEWLTAWDIPKAVKKLPAEKPPVKKAT